MNTKLVRTLNNETCLQHEEQIQELARKTAELEAHASFKEQRIMEIIEDNKRIEGKIDNLTETVNKVMLNSIKDDNNLNQRVTTLETTIKTQDDTIKKFEEKQRKEREEDRAKTTQYMAVIGTVIGVLSFIFAYIIK